MIFDYLGNVTVAFCPSNASIPGILYVLDSNANECQRYGVYGPYCNDMLDSNPVGWLVSLLLTSDYAQSPIDPTTLGYQSNDTAISFTDATTSITYVYTADTAPLLLSVKYENQVVAQYTFDTYTPTPQNSTTTIPYASCIVAQQFASIAVSSLHLTQHMFVAWLVVCVMAMLL